MKENEKNNKLPALDKPEGSYSWKDVKLILQGKEVTFKRLIYRSKK